MALRPTTKHFQVKAVHAKRLADSTANFLVALCSGCLQAVEGNHISGSEENTVPVDYSSTLYFLLGVLLLIVLVVCICLTRGQNRGQTNSRRDDLNIELDTTPALRNAA
eukprot:501480-Rhodomonas_salina.2